MIFEEIPGYDPLMRIGEVARHFQVNPRTIRTWEERGDIEGERNTSGVHCYRESVVRELTGTLEWVRALEDAGLADGILRCRKCGYLRAKNGCTVWRNGSTGCAALPRRVPR